MLPRAPKNLFKKMKTILMSIGIYCIRQMVALLTLSAMEAISLIQVQKH